MAEDRFLAGKSAVVVGAGRGIGRAISRALAREGAFVHAVSRTSGEVEETIRLVKGDGGAGAAVALDATVPEAIFEVLRRRVGQGGRAAQILVNCAGVYGPIAPVATGDPSEWTHALEVNVLAPYLVCRAFVGDMIALGWGRVVNVSSAAALAPPAALSSAYTTGKVALNHFTRCLAVELEGTGVTANAIHPGEVRTAMWRDIRDRAARAGVAAEPLRAWARQVDVSGGDPPEQAADLVLYLVSRAGADINGKFLGVRDGVPHVMEPV